MDSFEERITKIHQKKAERDANNRNRLELRKSTGTNPNSLDLQTKWSNSRIFLDSAVSKINKRFDSTGLCLRHNYKITTDTVIVQIWLEHDSIENAQQMRIYVHKNGVSVMLPGVEVPSFKMGEDSADLYAAILLLFLERCMLDTDVNSLHYFPT